MIKYRGDQLYVKIQLFLASISWGLINAWFAIKITSPLTGWIVTPLRFLVFILGFFSLSISVNKKGERKVELN